MKPIDIGSTWKFSDGSARFNVTNMFVDEDGETQLSIDYFDVEKSLSVHADDLRDLMRSDMVERMNDGHEAWQSRQ